ncbi:MAG: o-succinylbenzoate synthase [Dechloromonas sp.]|nr:o-succinylbenzoate synthase [Dechloromonas sp.]
MNIVATDWLPYTLPLKRPWQTSRGSFSERHGRLLHLRTRDGLSGWGDCAPWPAFGIDEVAATGFAEETAMLDLAAQQAGLPLDAWLSGNRPLADLAVNALLGDLSLIDEASLERALAEGYAVLKIKVGVGLWQDEITRLESLAGRLPVGRKFRLDANAAWDMAEARGFLRACNGLPIEGLEEPLCRPTLDALASLQSAVAFPLAIDESQQLVDRQFFKCPAVHRLILKPARHGGLLASLDIGLRAKAAGIECIVTSSLESACGLLACAHLAAVIAPRSTHGLATADWLTEDTGAPPSISNGRLSLPGTAGLGFIPGSLRGGEQPV